MSKGLIRTALPPLPPCPRKKRTLRAPDSEEFLAAGPGLLPVAVVPGNHGNIRGVHCTLYSAQGYTCAMHFRGNLYEKFSTPLSGSILFLGKLYTLVFVKQS